MSDVDDIDGIGRRVRDAIAMNVDLMDRSPRIVERALVAAGEVRQHRRRRRALAGVVVVMAAVVGLAGVAVADHGQSGVAVTAVSPTSAGAPAKVRTHPRPKVTTPAKPKVPITLRPKAPIWTNVCGVAPTVTSIPGLHFTLDVPSTVVRPGGSAAATVVLGNTSDRAIQFMTGIGTWYMTTPGGRVVATSAGEVVISIGYEIVVPAHGVVRPSQLRTGFAAAVQTCTENGPPGTPLANGHYLAWFTLPTAPAGAVLLSPPVPFTVAGPTVWPAKVTRELAVRRGKRVAIDRHTAIVTAKLASWGEIQTAGANVGSSPTDNVDRRVWVVSISGAPHPGMCCLAPHKPFRWGVVFIDAETGEQFSFSAGSTGAVAPWFARLPDHGE